MAFEEDEPLGAPEWIVTFSDMISLLVTFFVLLLSFASVATKEQAKMKQFMKGMWGVFPTEGGAAVDQPVEELAPDRTYRINASLEKNSRPFEDVLHDLERAGLRKDDDRIPFDMSTSTSGIRLSFGDDERFAPGDDQPTPELEHALVRLADLIRQYPFEIIVEGHGDAEVGVADPLANPQTLGISRAAESAAVLCRSGKLDARRVSLSGLTGSDSPAERANDLDRRIELRLVQVKGL